MDKEKEIKQHVKKRYGEFATRNTCCCCSCNQQSTDLAEQAKSIGYSENDLEAIPEEAKMGLGCGNPAALAGLAEGETVLDLGSGAGIDVFLAAKKVGETGKVIGIDMTPEMIERSTGIAGKYGYGNVEFRLGEIEHLPVDDGSVDVILSNCVINLTPDKSTSYREAYRVLKPGGRLLVSDLVTVGTLPDDVLRSFDAWAECIAGAMEKEAYLGAIRTAGFGEVKVVSEFAYEEPGMDERLNGKILSIHVEARK